MPTGIQIFYLTCAASGLIFTAISAILGHRGHGGKLTHGHGPGGLKLGAKGTQGHTPSGLAHGQDQFISLSIISPLTGAIFLGLFGFLGLLASAGFNMSPTASLLLAAPLSLIISLSFSWAIMRLLVKSQSSSITDARNAVGLRAKVVTKIEQGKVGTISYIDNGTRLTLPARADTEEALERGEDVYICRTDGKTAIVRRDCGSLWQ